MALKNAVLLAVASAAVYAAKAPDVPTDTAAIESMLHDPAAKSSLDDAMNAFGDALSSALAHVSLDFGGDNNKPGNGDQGHDDKSKSSGAAVIKPIAAAAAVGLSVCAALF
ncbi:hypothetical protein LPJ61_000809 [Coemansia biformis]|uniref:Uncharacterized protein n=1 Tax=Coemansia biformis TaxID=1286918 RepID=A0A9W7YGD4_9FUNG|nr:hypothetical protein LPJ61_000809 [Coemansia biformis]